jgi:hypothetical protein
MAELASFSIAGNGSISLALGSILEERMRRWRNRSTRPYVKSLKGQDLPEAGKPLNMF